MGAVLGGGGCPWGVSTLAGAATKGGGSMKKEGAVKEGFHERGCHEGTPRSVNKRAVRILLECILVIIVVDTCTM